MTPPCSVTGHPESAFDGGRPLKGIDFDKEIYYHLQEFAHLQLLATNPMFDLPAKKTFDETSNKQL